MIARVRRDGNSFVYTQQDWRMCALAETVAATHIEPIQAQAKWDPNTGEMKYTQVPNLTKKLPFTLIYKEKKISFLQCILISYISHTLR